MRSRFLHWCIFQVILIPQFDETYAHRNDWMVPVLNPSLTFSLKFKGKAKLLIDIRLRNFKQCLRVLAKKCPINETQEIIFYCDITWLLGDSRKGPIFVLNPSEEAAGISQWKGKQFYKKCEHERLFPEKKTARLYLHNSCVLEKVRPLNFLCIVF